MTVLVVLAPACWSAAPADAAVSLPGEQVSAVATPTAVSEPPVTAPAVLPTHSAPVEETVRESVATVTDSTQPAAAAAARTVATPGAGAQPDVEPVASAVTPAAPTAPAAGQGGPKTRAPASTPPREAAQQGDTAPPFDRSRARRDTPGPHSTPAARSVEPAVPAFAASRNTTPAGTPVAAMPAHQDRPSPPDRRAPLAAGSGVSGGLGGLALGGLAILAVALCVAGPNLCRRLSIRPAMRRPAAFVPLLERPG